MVGLEQMTSAPAMKIRHEHKLMPCTCPLRATAARTAATATTVACRRQKAVIHTGFAGDVEGDNPAIRHVMHLLVVARFSRDAGSDRETDLGGDICEAELLEFGGILFDLLTESGIAPNRFNEVGIVLSERGVRNQIPV